MASHTSTSYTDRNNLISGTAGTLEAIREPGSCYNFGMKWAGADRVVSVDGSPSQPSVGLIQGTFPQHPDFGAQAYKNGHIWDTDCDAVLSVDWVAGTLAGTIKENYYISAFDSGGLATTRSLSTTRDNVDPGYGAIGAGRPGQQYSFVITGVEFRIYNARESNPVVILASPHQGPGFPLSLAAWVVGSASSGFNVPDIRIGRIRPHQFSTIYSARDRTADGVSSGLHVRIFQNPTPPLTVRGVTTDVDIT